MGRGGLSGGAGDGARTPAVARGFRRAAAGRDAGPAGGSGSCNLTRAGRAAPSALAVRAGGTYAWPARRARPCPVTHTPVMAHVRKSFPELLLESAMIVLSVLLALAASSWAESRREHRVASQARRSFAQEVRANRERVARAMPYHRALDAAVASADSAGDVHSYADWRRRVPIWSGFAPPDVTVTAWQAALATGALGNMRYGEIAALSDAYTVQGKLDAFTLSYLPLFDFSDAAMPGTVRRMHVYMRTVLSYETALLGEYDAALAALADGGAR